MHTTVPKFGVVKGIVHPKMKITPRLPYPPQAIIGVYDFLLSDEYNQSLKKNKKNYRKKVFYNNFILLNKCPGSSKFYMAVNGGGGGSRFWSLKKCIHPS